MTRRYMVTGADGFVGAQLVTELSLRGLDVLGTMLRPPPGSGVRTVDICDPASLDAVLSDVRVDTVIHAAAVSSGRGPVAEELIWRANVVGKSDDKARKGIGSIAKAFLVHSRLQPQIRASPLIARSVGLCGVRCALTPPSRMRRRSRR